MGRIIAIVNQKGGVGKTTTAVNAAAALAIAERATLLVDSDPQANTTRALGLEADPSRLSLYEVLGDSAPLDQVLQKVPAVPNLTLIPSDHNLIGAEVELVEAEGREGRLKQLLEPVRGSYDYVLVDCPPSLGFLTVNALTAADAILIPVQCEYLALEGITQLMDTIGRIRSSLNPDLEIEGILMTMYDERTNLARQVVEEVRGVFGNQVFRTVIPRNVKLGEAPSHGETIFSYDIRSRGAEAYLNLAKELQEHEAKGVRKGTAELDPGSPSPHLYRGVSEGVGSRPRGASGDRPRPDPAQPQPATRND